MYKEGVTVWGYVLFVRTSEVQNPIDYQQAVYKMMNINQESRDEYNGLIQKGRELYETLHSFARKDRVEYASLHDFYHINIGQVPLLSVPVVRALREWNADDCSTWVEVRSRTARSRAVRVGPPPFTNRFSGKTGAILAQENVKTRDENPPGERLWPSEIIWQSYLLVAAMEGSKPSKLSLIVRYNVENSSTLTAIWHAERMSTYTREGERGYREYTQIDDGYYAILGSPNGANTMRMLIDHKAEHRYREVERIVVLSLDSSQSNSSNEASNTPTSRTFFMVLSEPRQKPFWQYPSRIPKPSVPIRKARERKART